MTAPKATSRAPSAEDGYLAAAGDRLAIRRLAQPEDIPRQTTGGTAAPTLLFLHEALGSIGQWKDFPEALVAATGLPGLVYDRRGHGNSEPLTPEPLTLPRPKDYHQTEAAKILPALLDAAGIERAILVGHSDGGTIALLAAAALPRRIAAVVSEAAHVFIEEISRQGIRNAQAAWQRGELGGLERYHGDKTPNLMRAWAETWLNPVFDDWSTEVELAGVTCPVLAIQGVDDHYGSPEQVARICAGVAGPAEPLLLPDCGHTPHREQRDWVLRAIRDFLAEHALLPR
ncbi:alpha/beta fold hydrolase [Algihabitans albus]|uniref:alpha/beta fold hydrolase n=1 Tax=Algihabitans albus TaxID=2164067 RepID=UPI000E5D00BF|nr:alpha/beta hydrolase [Algihabitans albus]